jgi:DNA ligase (NAD+)
MESLERSKDVKLNRFIYALGIRHVGDHLASVLAEELGDLESLMKADRESLISIEGIGEEVAQSVLEFFGEAKNIDLIGRLKKAGVDVKAVHAKGESRLSGKRFVITGVLKTMSRSEAEEMIASLGGKASSSVSKNTNYLVYGENPGSKLDRARELDVEVITEERFLEILEE